MAYTLTYVNTNLPWYRTRVTVVSDGASGSATVTNGGYIESVAPVDESVDIATADAKLRSWSFVARNVGNMWSANIFTLSASVVSVLFEVSYDGGSTYEALFFGRVQLDQLSFREYDSVETRNWSYDVQCVSWLASLDEPINMISVLQPEGNTGGGLPGSGLQGRIVDSRGTVPTYVTNQNGTPIVGGTPPAATFYPVLSPVPRALEFIDFGGLTPPTLSVDSSLLELSAANDNTVGDFGISDWYVWAAEIGPPGLRVFNNYCMFGYYAGAEGLLDADTPKEMLKRICQGLGCVPVETYNSSTSTFSLMLVPRIPTAPAAVTGPLGPVLSRERHNGSWVSGGVVTTPGLPRTSRSASFGRKSYTIRGLLATNVEWSAGLDFYIWDSFTDIGALWSGVWRQSDTGAMVQSLGTPNQLFVKTGAATFKHAHRAKCFTGQSYYETPASPGYYGLQQALYEYLIGDNGKLRGVRRGMEIEYSGIKGATLADIRLLKKLTIDGVDYIIEGISRDVMRNTMRLSLGALP